MSKSFSGAEFIKALADGSLKPPIVLAGVTKFTECDPHAILFSQGTSCAFWTRITVEMIDKVDLITFVRCDDHEYPFVHICLKEVANNPAAEVLADLLRRSELNPQPLPPRWLVELNPQPLPPRWLVELNPQPLPPRWLVELNPQPLPPRWQVELNPQPLPPRRS
jgi:hypothetical protein